MCAKLHFSLSSARKLMYVLFILICFLIQLCCDLMKCATLLKLILNFITVNSVQWSWAHTCSCNGCVSSSGRIWTANYTIRSKLIRTETSRQWIVIVFKTPVIFMLQSGMYRIQNSRDFQYASHGSFWIAIIFIY